MDDGTTMDDGTMDDGTMYEGSTEDNYRQHLGFRLPIQNIRFMLFCLLRHSLLSSSNMHVIDYRVFKFDLSETKHLLLRPSKMHF